MSVTIGTGVTSIRDFAFRDCYKLVEVWNFSCLQVTVGKKDNGHIAYYAKQVYTTNEASKQTLTNEGYLFYENENESYLIAYRGDKTNLTLPAKSPNGRDYQINQYAFYNCNELTSIEIPDSVTSIGSSAFEGCSGLTSITIPDSVTSIGSSAFYGCYGLTSITIPDGVTSIGEFAFEGCSGLTSITIPNSVTSIGDYAFACCSSLESVEIPDSMTSIGNYAFEYCSGLMSITIPDSVTEIGYRAFDGCSSLTDIQFKGIVEAWQAINKGFWWDSNTGNYTVTCTDGTIDKEGNVTYFEQ